MHEDLAERFFLEPAAAYVRGEGSVELPERLRVPPLEALSQADRVEVLRRGRDSGLRVHRFKRSGLLARVRKVLGLLRSVAPTSLLDVGSGRGAFLWPLMDAFPELPVTCVEADPERARQLTAVSQGGVERLEVLARPVAESGLPDDGVDVLTFLEVLEHLRDPDAALREVCRLARRAVVITVPSKPDDNPEHLHLFEPRDLEARLLAAGARRVSLDGVHNHLVAVAMLPGG